MMLNGKQHEQIYEALRQAFTEDSLKLLIRHELNSDPSSVAGGSDFNARVYHLVDWAERQQRIDDLIRGAQKQNPSNVLVKGLSSLLYHSGRAAGASSAFVCYGDKAAIAVCDGLFWQNNQNDNSVLAALSSQIGEWEVFTFVHPRDGKVTEQGRPVLYGETVALQSLCNEQYVGVDLDVGGAPLTARVPWVRDWQMFDLLRTPEAQSQFDGRLTHGSQFVLRACNGKFVMYDRLETKHLLATASEARWWECFSVHRIG